MIIRLFLTCLLLLPLSFSILADEQEKELIIVQADNVPSRVESAAKAIGAVGGSQGFFIAKDAVVADIQRWSTSVAVNQAHNIRLFRKATAEQKKINDLITEKDSLLLKAGQAKLIQGAYGWGVFKVTKESTPNAFTVEQENFLTFSQFRPGDRIFILNLYHYDHQDSPGERAYKRNLIMTVSNSDIQSIVGQAVNLKESPLLNALNFMFHRSIAVNQNGEIIGLLEGSRLRLVPFDSSVVDFFSETAQEIRESERRASLEVAAISRMSPEQVERVRKPKLPIPSPEALERYETSKELRTLSPEQVERANELVAPEEKPRGILSRCAAIFKTKN